MDTPIEIELDAPKKIFTVAEITRNIRFTLEDKFSSVSVEGEISNFIHHGSGHMYFSLKDAEAGLQAVMFRQENARMRFKPENGMRVVCRGRVSVYPARGQYQLVCEAMEPNGLGDLQMAFEQLKKKLAAEGLFDEGRKRPIPHLPRCVGVVTSLTGAVIRDMLHVTARRFPGAHFLIAPAKVQGEGAKEEIVQALRDLDASGMVDVIVLARGGGSLEDLWAFNEEVVARAIMASVTPVVSAVGHEVDYTIADFVADLRAPTPSAAAEMLFPEKAELEAELAGSRRYLDRAILGRIEALRGDLEALTASRALKDPGERLRDRMQELDDVTRELARSARLTVERTAERLSAVTGRLEALGPMATLRRGFSITFRDAGPKVVRSVKGLKAGELLSTKLSDGTVTSRIQEIREDK